MSLFTLIYAIMLLMPPPLILMLLHDADARRYAKRVLPHTAPRARASKRRLQED